MFLDDFYIWEFNDGVTLDGQTVTRSYEDNGTYNATLTVADDDGATATQSLTITVNNVAPSIETDSSKTANEGETVTFDAAFSDPGNDELTVTWDFGDDSEQLSVGSEQSSVTHTYAEDGNYTVTLTVTDDDGASTTSTLDVTVNNLAPTINEIIGDTEVNEGEEVTYNAIASDAGDDTLTYSWDFGDGNSAEGENVTQTFTDNGNYTVTLTVTDDEEAFTSQTLDVTVHNLAPTITEIMGDTEVNEGAEVTYGAIASDPGNDTLTYSWDFGDGNSAEGETVTHTFTDNGNYTVTLTVTDDDGASTSQTLEVTVNVGTGNKPPIFAKNSTNLVQNWSFEDNEVQPNRWDVFKNIPGWNTTKGAGIEVQELNNRFGSGEDGTAWVELDSHNNSRMKQDIPTKPEASYQLSFAYSPRPNVKANSNGIKVYWNGQLLDTIQAQGSQKNNWQTYTYNVPASDLDLTALEFRAAGKSDSKGGFIDAVSVKEIIDLSETVTIQIPEQQSEVIDLMAFDPEGETEGNGLTYSIVGGADADLFNLDSETGLVSFIEAPDFAQPQDLDFDNIYELEVAVSDGQGLTDTVKLAIAIQTINQPLDVPNQIPDVPVSSENQVQNWSFDDNNINDIGCGSLNGINPNG